MRSTSSMSLGVAVWMTALLVSAQAFATDGRVIDERTGKPLAKVEVTILGRPGAVYTDADGRFSWKPDLRPPFEVLVILAGERFTKPVLVEQIPPDGVIEIRISPLVDETVTVTAGTAPDIEATMANATALLPAQEIQSRQPANLVQALETVAGVSTVSEGHAAVPAIRGLARGRTLILLDGARVTSDRRVGPSATFLDPFVLDGVEIARGPGSVAYGSDAFGGVIYARTRRIDPASPLAGRIVTALGAGAPQGRIGAEVSKGFGTGGVALQAHYRDFDDYRSPQGDVFNSGATDQGFLARGEVELGKGLLGASWQSDFGRDIGRPRNNSQTVRFYYPVEDSHRFTSQYELRQVGGFERVTVNAFAGSYLQVTDQDRYATATRGRTLEEADYEANDFQLRASAERLFSRARFEMGVDVNGRFNVHATDTVTNYGLDGSVASQVFSESIEQARRNDTGAYASVEAALGPKATVAAGLRGDYMTSHNQGGYFGDHDTSNGALSGSGSITVGPWSGVSFVAQAGSGFRDATVSDRYYRGPTGRGFITGNPELKPERSVQFDLGMRYTGSRVRLGLFGFQYNIKDLIERYQTAADFFFFRNRGEARIRGLELEVQARLAWMVALESTATLTRGIALDDDAAIDDMPPATFTLGLRRPVSSRGFVQLRGSFFAVDDRPGPTEARMPGYTVVDAIAGATVAKWLDLNLNVRNLLDATYPQSPDPRAVPASGISAVLTANLSF
jgi:outer membrane receptor protein involved in Fe transport